MVRLLLCTLACLTCGCVFNGAGLISDGGGFVSDGPAADAVSGDGSITDSAAVDTSRDGPQPLPLDSAIDAVVPDTAVDSVVPDTTVDSASVDTTVDTTIDSMPPDTTVDTTVDTMPDIGVDMQPSCDAVFGGATNYLYCSETPTTCKFYVLLNGISCDALCSARGESCVKSIFDDESGSGGATCVEQGVGSCSSTANDRICECTRP